MTLTHEELNRYSRHILLKEVGGAGQARLLKSRILVVGAGGIGSPALLYLAAAGIGTLGIIDNDLVSLSNLQRQIIHGTDALDRPKTQSAAKSILALNPGIKVECHDTRLNGTNALSLVASYDLVVDGSDNYETRALVNDACYFAEVPLVSAAVGRFEGQLSTFRAYERAINERDSAPRLPCYRCLYPLPPPQGSIMTCEEAGILGAIAGVMGSLAAVEALKEILGLGISLAGQLVIYDGLSTHTRKVKLTADPACALCGETPSINDLSVHAA